VVGGVSRRLLLTITLSGGLVGICAAQPPANPYESLSASQRAILPWSVDAAPNAYNIAPPAFRRAFEIVTTRVTALSLSDPENGEVLGSAIDLIERVEAPGAQPPSDAQAVTLSVTLAPGARDRLRRSREFARADAAAPTFVYGDPPAIRIEIADRASFAVVTVLQP
jgi:hypothetical protein